MVGAGAGVPRRAGLVREPLRLPAGPGLRLVRLGGARVEERRRARPAGADPAVHRRVHGRVHAPRARSRPRSCRSFKGMTGQRVAGAVVIVLRAADDRVRAPARIGRGSTRSGVRSCRGCGRGRWGRYRSGWRSPPGGRRASGRCSAASSRSPSQGGTARGGVPAAATRLGLGVPFLLVGLGISGSWARSDGCGATTSRSRASRAALLVVVGVLLFTGAFTRFFAPLSPLHARALSRPLVAGAGPRIVGAHVLFHASIPADASPSP